VRREVFQVADEPRKRNTFLHHNRQNDLFATLRNADFLRYVIRRPGIVTPKENAEVAGVDCLLDLLIEHLARLNRIFCGEDLDVTRLGKCVSGPVDDVQVLCGIADEDVVAIESRPEATKLRDAVPYGIGLT
jgi:hypothetical protein